MSFVPIPASVDAKIIAARSPAARPTSAALLRSLPRIPDHVINRALAQIDRSRQQEWPIGRLLQPWELVARERERERDFSLEQRQEDLRRLKGRY